jgi:hypothetical protein
VTDEQTPIDKAIDAVEEGNGHPPEGQLRVMELPIHPAAVRLGEAGTLTVIAPDKPNETILLARDPTGVWRAVLLPPGSRWELRPERPALWRPGMPS